MPKNRGKKKKGAQPPEPVEHITLSDDAVLVDGSMLEGGGQVLRQSTACAAILCKELRIVNIRAKRSSPGLKAQHLAGIRLVCDMCNAEISGDVMRSSEVRISPQPLTSADRHADIGTAGSLALLMQVSVPPLLYSPRASLTTLRGGTNVGMSPQIDYIERVFSPIASRMGVNIEIDVRRRGFFPKGGGLVVLQVRPLAAGETLLPIELMERGEVQEINMWCYHSLTMSPSVPRRIIKTACDLVAAVFPSVMINEEVVYVDEDHARDTSAGILITARTTTGCILAGSAIVDKGVSAESVGERAANMLLESLQAGGCVDEHLQDQLIIFMALAGGHSRLRCGPLSLHTETAIHFAQELTGATFAVSPVEDTTQFVIECDGIGVPGKAEC